MPAVPPHPPPQPGKFLESRNYPGCSFPFFGRILIIVGRFGADKKNMVFLHRTKTSKIRG